MEQSAVEVGGGSILFSFSFSNSTHHHSHFIFFLNSSSSSFFYHRTSVFSPLKSSVFAVYIYRLVNTSYICTHFTGSTCTGVLLTSPSVIFTSCKIKRLIWCSDCS